MKIKVGLQWKLILLFLINLAITIGFVTVVTKFAITRHFQQFCELSVRGLPECMQGQGGQQFLQSINQSLLIAGVFGLVIALLLGYLFSRSFLKPFQKIIASAKKASTGNYQVRISTKTYDETDQLITTLNEMYQSLEKIETLRKELVANMSHELSTPLTNIYGYLEALSDGVINDPEKQQETINLIKEEAERVIQLIKELKKLAILESEDPGLNQTWAEINDLIKTTAKSFQKKLDTKNIELKLELENNLPKIKLDKHKMRQVISNLLDNAIKYSAAGSTITVKTYQPDQQHLSFAVADQGIGIKQEDIPLIFERFFQTDKSRSREGIGIGLTIVQKIIKAHQGEIQVKSEWGKGTTFKIRLPVNEKQATA